MNFKKVTIGIVTYKSEKVIFDCLKSLNGFRNIIIWDNSYDTNLKSKILKKYPYINFKLSKNNLGYGGGNNSIAKLCKTKYLFIISPDVILKKNCIKNLAVAAEKLKNKFHLLSPLSNEKNFGYFNKTYKNKKSNIIDIDYLKGFAIFVNLKKFKSRKLFDENYFLYLEEIDLCKRIIKKEGKIFLIKNSYLKHLAAKSSNIGYEYEKCRNWHWMWSKTYFNIKHKNYFYSITEAFMNITKYTLKSIFFLLFDLKKSEINLLRAKGTTRALLGKSSNYRPEIN